MKNTKIFGMSFASVYPLYIKKAEKKGRTKEEVDEIIFWLTGYDEAALQQQLDNKVDFETFFAQESSAVTALKRSKTNLCKRSVIWIS